MTLRSYVLAVFNGGSSNLFVYNAKPMYYWPHMGVGLTSLAVNGYAIQTISPSPKLNEGVLTFFHPYLLSTASLSCNSTHDLVIRDRTRCCTEPMALLN